MSDAAEGTGGLGGQVMLLCGCHVGEGGGGGMRMLLMIC